MIDEPVHKAGSFTVERLPERIAVPQDVEDIYARFQEEANRYVEMRQPRGEFHGMRFIYPNDIDLVTEDNKRELHRLLRSERTDTIPMRHALNAVASFVKAIEAARTSLGMSPIDGPRDDMGFYYYLADKIDALQVTVREQFALIGQQQSELEKRKAAT